MLDSAIHASEFANLRLKCVELRSLSLSVERHANHEGQEAKTDSNGKGDDGQPQIAPEDLGEHERKSNQESHNSSREAGSILASKTAHMYRLESTRGISHALVRLFPTEALKSRFEQRPFSGMP